MVDWGFKRLRWVERGGVVVYMKGFRRGFEELWLDVPRVMCAGCCKCKPRRYAVGKSDLIGLHWPFTSYGSPSYYCTKNVSLILMQAIK